MQMKMFTLILGRVWIFSGDAYSNKFFKEIIKVKTSARKKSEFQVGFEPTTLRDLVDLVSLKNLFEYFLTILTLEVGWLHL